MAGNKWKLGLLVGALCVWSAVVLFCAQGMPLGMIARYFAPPQPDPAWFESWFAAKLPLFNTLVRGGLAILPWGLWTMWLGYRHGSRWGSFLGNAKVFACALGIAVLMSFPPPIAASSPGLDQSWQWFLNFVAGKGVFGKEVVFTYGPLGYLLMPQVCIGNAFSALAANVFFLLFWSFCLWEVFRLSEGGRYSAWLLLLTMFIPQANMEWRWVALACLGPCVILVRRLVDGGEQPPVKDMAFAVTSGLVLALSSLMKFSSLVTIAGAQLFVFCMVGFCSKRRRFFPGLCWGCAFLLGFMLCAVLSFESLADMVAWAKGSVLIADGYNKFFLSEKSVLQLVLAPSVLAVACFLFLRKNQSWREVVVMGVVLSPMFFCTLKYSWTRQGPTAFYYLLSVASAMVVAVSPNLMRRAGSLVFVLLVVSWVLVLPRVLVGTATFDFALGLNPTGIVETVGLAKTTALAQQGTARTARENALPKDWITQIGDARVQFLPYDFTPAMEAHRFAFCPIPVLQLYSAYLPDLDALCAAVYTRKDPPKYLVVTTDPMWCGYLFNHPQTWQAVLLHYEYVDSRDKRILLRRRDSSGPAGNPSSKEDLVVQEGVWLPCTTWPKGTQMAVQWPQTIYGRLCTTFFRNTLTYVSFKYADGSVFRFPLNPATTAYAFPVDAIPRSADELVAVFKGKSLELPIAMRFESITPGLYTPSLVLSVLNPVRL